MPFAFVMVKTWKQTILFLGTSLVVQWLGICLPMQKSWVWSLDWEDGTCLGATKPICHNYWVHMPQLLWSPWNCTAAREAMSVRSQFTATRSRPCSLRQEKVRSQQQRPSTAKNKYIKFFKKHYNFLCMCLVSPQNNKWKGMKFSLNSGSHLLHTFGKDMYIIPLSTLFLICKMGIMIFPTVRINIDNMCQGLSLVYEKR